MGQSTTVQSRQIDGFCVFTTDRVLTGQDGETYRSQDEADAAAGFPAQLASRLFARDEAIDHVYIASSDVIVRRVEGWDSAAVDSATAVIRDIYRFYED